MVKHPPDVLITTPESLYLMLTSGARAIFEGTETVILDEIHAVAQTKRGAHLAITLERLVEQAGRDVQRVGLSATQNPLEEVGRFMVGPKRSATIVDTGVRKPLDLKIHVPVDSAGAAVHELPHAGLNGLLGHDPGAVDVDVVVERVGDHLVGGNPPPRAEEPELVPEDRPAERRVDVPGGSHDPEGERIAVGMRVHLLLAAQRLEGARLRGLDVHLTYRIVLRMFSVQDSQRLVGVDDGAELPTEPGHGDLRSECTTVRFRSARVTPVEDVLVAGLAGQGTPARPLTW